VTALLIVLIAAGGSAQPRPRVAAREAMTVLRAPPLADFAQLAATVGSLRADAGSWAEYLVRTRGDQDVRFRISAVPPAVDGGRVWLEVAVLGSESLPFAARLLVVAATGTVERAAIYALGQAPLDIPIRSHAGAMTTAPGRPPVRIVQERDEEVTVAAGTFRATRLRISGAGGGVSLWKSDAVPLWGLVRARARRQSIELLRYGHGGARSLFPFAQGNGTDSANE
jgi:hypothetical protein